MLEKIRVNRPKLLTHFSFSQPRMSPVLAVCLSLDSTTGYGVAADIFWYSSGFWVKQKIVCLSVCLSLFFCIRVSLCDCEASLGIARVWRDRILQFSILFYADAALDTHTHKDTKTPTRSTKLNTARFSTAKYPLSASRFLLAWSSWMGILRWS